MSLAADMRWQNGETVYVRRGGRGVTSETEHQSRCSLVLQSSDNTSTEFKHWRQCGISPVSHPRSHSQHWMIYVHLKQKRLPSASLSLLLLLIKGVATQVEKGRTEILILDAVETLGGVLSVSPPASHHWSFFFFSSFPLFLFSSFPLFLFSSFPLFLLSSFLPFFFFPLVLWTEHPHTRLFLDTFILMHTSHCGSRCRTTCLHKTCSSICHHMSERLLFPCFVFFLCVSCLYVLSHFYLFSVQLP